MTKDTQIELLGKIIIEDTDISLDVWRPPVKHIKSILGIEHIRVKRNNQQADCTIFTIHFKDRVSVTLFCDETGAKFMRKYYKEKGGE